MRKTLLIFFISFMVVLIIDQAIKQVFLGGFTWQSKIIDLYLVFNTGVAFSMFSSLGESLKYIQIALIASLFLFLYLEKEFFKENILAIGFIFGAGSSNILDRFLHGGVVDYIAWHYKFEFAVFNFADVMINFGVFLIILRAYLNYREKRYK
ncbi:MAG: signal peptidase II [Campylobacteraceae bacterium]|nr:signal peptidase II [Campylobacteraceae bacterium]